MDTVAAIIGTRPEAIKMLPLVRALRARDGVDVLVVVTGQHRHMLDQVFKAFGEKADVDLDLMAPGVAPSEAGIQRLQSMKIGALILFACEAGAIIAGASAADRERRAEFGSAVGLAFQLADDLLDVTASAAALGNRRSPSTRP